jgi:hypothetical protein
MLVRRSLFGLQAQGSLEARLSVILLLALLVVSSFSVCSSDVVRLFLGGDGLGDFIKKSTHPKFPRTFRCVCFSHRACPG